ncbi:electron transport complex subunit RsxG [Candidatus Enterovibrio escicola]|uniref:Ion-translocating oxidoreductase complex subunit G n=1 Tax=Candidatus Enterovibrio escicola TaxID=1927127 RepID=A0A2A5T357_9GAMM|nr:electron transport complex subunit RsxG [Candidatus Enterovibrio escacola]PCS22560.1 Electron transport complex protein RnfG [Candidatus Enterovibrio escacola]
MIRAMKNNGAILALAALFSTGIVAITDALTKDTIAEQELQQLLQVLNQVLPATMHDNILSQNCTLVSSPELGTDDKMPVYIATKNGKPTGMVVKAFAQNGYNGAIKVLVGVDTNNTVVGVRVLQHNETVGLGDRIDLNISNWILSFSGKSINSADDKRWAVHKDGGQFNQFTGATITPRAIVNAVRKVSTFLFHHKNQILYQPSDCSDEL